jgi:probable phosphoglycerate mutase
VTIVLVRHGETDWSRDGMHTGRTDRPLTETGRTEATALASRFDGHPFSLVLTSPLRRARDTASLAGFPGAVLDADLVEWDYGDYEGRTTSDIQGEHPGWDLFRDGVPHGESIDDVAARAERVIARVRAASGDSLVFAHGHVLRVLTARWLDVDPAFGARLAFGPAAVSELADDKAHGPLLQTWNT